jgi:LysR family transcriptional regulator, nitrogen assimilation regulatory protein
MDSETLRFFLRVSELGSFGRAAQVLNTSQPTLSRRIALLEREVGAQVFVRHQRGVSLTPSGLALERRAASLMQQLQHLHEEVGVSTREPSGSLALGLPPSLVTAVSGPLIEAYRRSCPRVDLFIFEGITDELEEKLANGELDIALMFPIRSKLHNVTVRPLASEQMACVQGSPKFPGKQWVTVADMSDLPLILYRLPNYVRWLVELAFQRHGLSPNVVAEVNSLPMLLELSRQNVGFGILPMSAAAHDIRSGALHGNPVRGMPVKWTLAVARERKGSLAVKALLSCLDDIVKKQIQSGKWKATLA